MLELSVLFLFVFGTLFGSFASVVIYRIRSGEGGIWGGRSHCKDCSKLLQAIDLIPIFSYMMYMGKCRRCSSKISLMYPTLEIVMGLLFAAIGYFIIDIPSLIQGDIGQIIKLIFLLLVAFLTVVYAFYDILFLEIPEGILCIGNIGTYIFLAGVMLFSGTIFVGNNISIFQILLAYIVGASVIAGLYVIMLKELDTWYDILILAFLGLILLGVSSFYTVSILAIPILSGAIAAYSVFLFFYLQILVSGGAWMGGGDLRIAVFMGFLLGLGGVFHGILLTYILGSCIGIGLIVYKKYIQKQKGKIDTMIPFGPFLALGTWGTLLFGNFLFIFLKGF